MKFIQSIFTCFTIWVVAAMLNSVLSGSVVWFFSSEFTNWPSTILLAFMATLAASIPGMFIYWIILLVNWEAAGVFRTLLKAGIIISLLSSILVYAIPLGMDNMELLFLPGCIVIAFIASMMFHHKVLIRVTAKNKI